MKDKTVKEVFDTLTEEQKKVVYFLVHEALENKKRRTTAWELIAGENFVTIKVKD